MLRDRPRDQKPLAVTVLASEVARQTILPELDKRREGAVAQKPTFFAAPWYLMIGAGKDLA